MSLTLRRAFPGYDVLNARGLNALIDDAFATWPFNGNTATVASAWLPVVDISEDKESLRIVAELPGLKPEDVKITLENNTLTIKGEKKQASEEKSEKVHRYERSYGSFVRSFSLPNTIDADRVQAGVEHGVLTITLPKAERAKPREIQVSVK